jgi:chromosome partitioning protein
MGKFSGNMASRAHFIVFANEKGGTGKSTTAVHVAVALAAQGRKVAAIDLDTRQKTLARYLENRVATQKREAAELPCPVFEVFDPTRDDGIDARLDALAAEAEFVIVDTPGRDDAYAMKAASRADTLVTPINDSFIDLDLIGQVDPETYRIKRPSFYAEMVWEARKARAKTDGGTVDWVVLRNRLQHLEAKNMRRVGAAVDELAKRVGFRVIPGLGERVIYRELFPKGLTLLDLGAIREVGLSHVAARQELREMVSGLQLPEAEHLFNRPPPAVATA